MFLTLNLVQYKLLEIVLVTLMIKSIYLLISEDDAQIFINTLTDLCKKYAGDAFILRYEIKP
jgi:hypothetical protein